MVCMKLVTGTYSSFIHIVSAAALADTFAKLSAISLLSTFMRPPLPMLSVAVGSLPAILASLGLPA